ncbi:LTXXQ motif family protein [Rhabdaerophilaceae bacterium]
MSETRSFFSRTSTKWLIVGTAVLTIGVGASFAEWGGGSRWRSGPQHGMGPMGGGANFCARDPLKFEGVARAFLKADLDLKTEQNAELEKLAGTLVPALKDLRDEICNNFVGKSAPAPERLERFALILRKAADAAEKTVPPTKAFYATLDDRQKARVDELSERRRHGGGHRRGEFFGEGRGQGQWR